MSQFDYQQFHQNHLPHIQPPEATLFVTFRLAGSVPKPVLGQWLAEKKWLEEETKRVRKLNQQDDAPETKSHEERLLAFRRRWFQKFEDLLHQQAHGPQWLSDARVAEIVTEALHFRDGKVYRLEAYCVMSNHVHAVFAPLLTEAMAKALAEQRVESDEFEKYVLSVIMHSLKGFTARQANLALGRAGQFWEHESYDHVIRVGGFDRVVNYVLQNPVKAGLVQTWQEWQWSWRRSPAEAESALASCTANC